MNEEEIGDSTMDELQNRQKKIKRLIKELEYELISISAEMYQRIIKQK